MALKDSRERLGEVSAATRLLKDGGSRFALVTLMFIILQMQ